MKYLTVQEIQCVGPDSCEQRINPLMEALFDLEAADAAIADPDLAADLSTGCVDIQMIVDAPDPAAAMVKALATLRAAIHAIGDATPGWETTTAVMHVGPADVADRDMTTKSGYDNPIHSLVAPVDQAADLIAAPGNVPEPIPATGCSG
jgi:hypothetical protein